MQGSKGHAPVIEFCGLDENVFVGSSFWHPMCVDPWVPPSLTDPNLSEHQPFIAVLPSNLKMEAAWFFETLVSNHHTTQCNNLETTNSVITTMNTSNLILVN
jgi:hypothetical protein